MPYFGNYTSKPSGTSARYVDWDDVDERGSSEGLPAGGYLCTIAKMKADSQKERVDLVFEVDAAGSPDYDPDDGYGDLARTVYLSYKRDRLPRLKQKLKRICDSNPGFDAFEAWNADLQSFVGKKIGVVVSKSESRDYYGATEVRAFAEVIPVEAIRSGDYTVPGFKALDGSREDTVPGVPVDFPEGGSPDEESEPGEDASSGEAGDDDGGDN